MASNNVWREGQYHYSWLDQFFQPFLRKIGIEMSQKACDSIVVCDADKCYGYAAGWAMNGIPFEYGVALYLITKLSPFCEEVRETANGWVAPNLWVIHNYPRFKNQLLESEQKTNKRR